MNLSWNLTEVKLNMFSPAVGTKCTLNTYTLHWRVSLSIFMRTGATLCVLFWLKILCLMTVKLLQILWLLANNTASSPGPSSLQNRILGFSLARKVQLGLHYSIITVFIMTELGQNWKYLRSKCPRQCRFLSMFARLQLIRDNFSRHNLCKNISMSRMAIYFTFHSARQ